MRIALGCMRLSTDGVLDDDRAIEVIVAALASGVDVLDTARSYGPVREGVVVLGHNERLVARALARQSGRSTRIVTKCGMRREGEAWVPDGRASTILEDAAASAEALGRPPDVLLLHAPDPRTPLATSLRALAKARDEGLARTIGLANVGRKDIVAAEVPLAVVDVALGAFDDAPTRGGVIEACAARGIEVFAHAPFGGPKRAARLARDGVLAAQASRLGTTPYVLFLAYMCSLHASIVPVVGARQVATARDLAVAATLPLDDEARSALAARFSTLTSAAPSAPRASGREVVMIMGLPGAGKSELAGRFVAEGHQRLNRDTLGGTLKGIVKRLDEALAAGASGVVLDNTYVTRALRSDVVRVASRHGAQVRCIFVDTPADEARINVVGRILRQHGRLLDPDALKALSKTDPTALGPSAVNRMLRDLEAPEADEGFAAIEVRPFERRHGEGIAGLAVPLEAIARRDPSREHGLLERAPMRSEMDLPRDARVLVFGWWPVPREEEARVMEEATRFAAARFGAGVEVTICTHPAGPPVCWCRPPLPGAWLAFAHRHGVDVRKSAMIATSPAHHTMARTLGLRVVA